MNITAIYPGTFDPITNGHSDLIERAAKLFDRVIVAIAASPKKTPMFSIDERVSMASNVLSGMENVEVTGFDSLLVNTAQQCDAQVILRGLRAVSDFEYEFQLAGMNRRLNPMIETVFLMASDRHQLIASHLVKEVAALGGDVGHFVSPRVKTRLLERYGREL